MHAQLGHMIPCSWLYSRQAQQAWTRRKEHNSSLCAHQNAYDMLVTALQLPPDMTYGGQYGPVVSHI